MKAISNLKTPSEILMLVNIPAESVKISTFSEGKHLFLDDVQDPGNVGTLIRSAAWFGCDSVIRTHGSADFYNSKVVQATMGAIAHIPLYSMEKSDISKIENHVCATDMEGTSFKNLETIENFVLVLSNEGKGISQEVKEKADKIITIPHYGNDQVESLNVAIAGSIILSKMI